jgi:hypothetical protein
LKRYGELHDEEGRGDPDDLLPELFAPERPQQPQENGEYRSHLHYGAQKLKDLHVASYAFSLSGSPKMPVGRTSSTMMRIVKATASRMGVEM